MLTTNEESRADDDGGSPTPVTDAARRVAREAIDAAAEKAGGIERKVRSESDRLGERAGEARQDGRESFDEALASIEAFIRREPVKAAGMAFAAGLVAALILRR